jgi:hypothetical protein
MARRGRDDRYWHPRRYKPDHHDQHYWCRCGYF